MVPFAAKDFAGVLFEDSDRGSTCNIEQLKASIPTSTEDLVRIGFIEADIILCVRGRPFSNKAHINFIGLN